ncbi:hypothetical protein [Adhaeribacter rhizoryzae]|uniref:Uncharacterized protein n=1 Tax=Adhaeribacter rhizoryzae TaxID=2607907 RepID=A0A5M6DKY0_9BACT|nr:hypothetical protein [Adhaeribacter rhizoryzae]KAA5548103.1 hypothetical protein F0145_05085 [Adhaeribacter rhizoryzae]
MKVLDNPKHTSDEKLHWEIEKLKAEVDTHKRSHYKNPSLIITALLGILGIWLQYKSSNREYQLAEIKKEQAEPDIANLEVKRTQVTLDITNLNKKRAETDQLLAQAQQDLNTTLQQRKLEEQKIADAFNSLTKAQAALAKGQSSTAVVAAVKDATALIKDASQTNQVNAQKSRATLKRIERLRKEVTSKKNPKSKLNGF